MAPPLGSRAARLVLGVLVCVRVPGAACVSCPARRPNVAVCLAGHARTFASHSVIDGLLRHLYLGDFGANMTTFLYLKLHDRSTKGATYEENQRTGIHSTHQNVSHVAHFGRKLPGLAKLEVVAHDPAVHHLGSGSRRQRRDRRSASDGPKIDWGDFGQAGGAEFESGLGFWPNGVHGSVF